MSEDIATTSSLVTPPAAAEVEKVKEGRPELKPFQHQIEGPLYLIRDTDGSLRLEVRKTVAHKPKEQDVRVIASVPVREEHIAQALALVSGADIKSAYLYFLDGVFGRISDRPIEVRRVEKKVEMAGKVVVDKYHFFKMMQAAIEDRTEHFRQTAGITQLSKMLNITFAEARQAYQDGLKYIREKSK